MRGWLFDEKMSRMEAFAAVLAGAHMATGQLGWAAVSMASGLILTLIFGRGRA